MKKGHYLRVKGFLKETAKEAKTNHKGDKPMIRQIINDTADYLCRTDLTGGAISEAKSNQFCYWLHSYAANLHPSN